MCQTAQPPIGQFCLPWWVAWPLFILNDLIGLIRSHELIYLPCSWHCLHQVVLFFVDDFFLDLKLFFTKCIGYVCPIFHKIGNARGWIPSKLGVLGVSPWGREHPWDWIILTKKCRVPFVYAVDILKKNWNLEAGICMLSLVLVISVEKMSEVKVS